MGAAEQENRGPSHRVVANVSSVTVWRDPQVWAAVASRLRAYRTAGLTGLMTEDTVRFATAQALADAGTPPEQMHVEGPHPVLRGSRVDLALGLQTPTALLEFKFPREPNELNAAWTMVLGEVLKDFYRLASCPGEMDRLFVHVETPRLRRYMAGAAGRYGLDLDVEHVALRPADAARLPSTAAQIVGAELAAHHVVAQRLQVLDVDGDLRLMVYLVDALNRPPTAAAGLLAATTNKSPLPQPVAPQAAPAAPETRDGARREILQAVHAVLTGSGTDTFTPAEHRRRDATSRNGIRRVHHPDHGHSAHVHERTRERAHHVRRPGARRPRPLPSPPTRLKSRKLDLAHPRWGLSNKPRKSRLGLPLCSHGPRQKSYPCRLRRGSRRRWGAGRLLWQSCRQLRHGHVGEELVGAGDGTAADNGDRCDRAAAPVLG